MKKYLFISTVTFLFIGCENAREISDLPTEEYHEEKVANDTSNDHIYSHCQGVTTFINSDGTTSDEVGEGIATRDCIKVSGKCCPSMVFLSE